MPNVDLTSGQGLIVANRYILEARAGNRSIYHDPVDKWMKDAGVDGAAAFFDFTEQKYGFRNAAGVPRRGSLATDLTFARASAAGRWPEAGPYEMVGSGALRYDHDPVTRAPLGVRIERAATNLLTNSEVVSTVRNVTVTAQAYTLAMEGSGSLALSGAYSGALAGGATRQTLTFTPSAGTLTITPSGEALRVQLETGSAASSYIVTGASILTRAAERLSYTIPFVPAIDGVTIAIKAKSSKSSNVSSALFSLGNGLDGTNYLVVYAAASYVFNGGGSWAFSGGLVTAGVFVPDGEEMFVISVSNAGVCRLSRNGGAVITKTIATGVVPAGATRLDLFTSVGAAQWRGTGENVTVWKGTPFSDAQMREVSAL